MNCPFCQNKIPPDVFFCPVCGKKIKETPLSTTVGAQILLYALSLFLPPFNIGMTIKYLKSADPKAKTIGWVSLIMMIVALIVVGVSTYYFSKRISDQVNQELKIYQQYGF